MSDANYVIYLCPQIQLIDVIISIIVIIITKVANIYVNCSF